MRNQKDRLRWGEAALFRLAALGEQAAMGWRALHQAINGGVARARRDFARSFDDGYAPPSSEASGFLGAPGFAVSDLTVAYRGPPAIEQVSVEFPPCSMTAIIGPNGAGKSTLLKALAGILAPRSGHITREAAAAGDIAYLPQSDEIDRSFPISVGEFVALGAWRHFGVFRPTASATESVLGAALETVGLAAVQHRPIAALSAGQFRRALFARLMLQGAGALLLDEPFTAIDAATTADLLHLVECWHGEGRTIIAVLHDLAQVQAHFPRVVLLARRSIAAGDTTSVLTPENLARAGIALREDGPP